MLRRYLLRVSVALLMAACTESVETELSVKSESSEAIGFNACEASDSVVLTRTAVGTVTSIKTNGYSFGVFASRTGQHTYANSSITSDFMHDQKVTYSTSAGGFTYTPVKYWPNTTAGQEEDYLSFFAYAPHRDYNSKSRACITDCSRPYEQGDPWIVYRLADNPANQVDLLYADPVLDRQKSNVNSKVSFTFRHALACVGDKITIDCTKALCDKLWYEIYYGGQEPNKVEILLRSVTIDYKLALKGRLVLNSSGSANWQPIISEDLTTTRTVSFDYSSSPKLLGTITYSTITWSGNDNSYRHTENNKGVLYIPMAAGGLAQKAIITMDYTIRRTYSTGTSEYDGSATSTLSLANNGGEREGRYLDLNLHLGDQITVNRKWVDLGLSVKWAATNVGARIESDYGLYFAWGATTGYSLATAHNYSSAPTTSPANPTILSSTYDAAAQSSDYNDGRMPTIIEFMELVANTTRTWETVNGVPGIRFTSKKTGYTDQSIFLPAAGARSDNEQYFIGESGHYWSSTIVTNTPICAWELYFYNDTEGAKARTDQGPERSLGHPIRAVKK